MKLKKLLSGVMCLLIIVSCVGTVVFAQVQKPKYFVNTLYKLKNDKELTVGYFGGSVTAGTGLIDDDVEKYCWRALTRDWLKNNFTDASENIVEINAAIGGTGSNFGVFRAEKMYIKDKAPDLNFIEMAINDYYEDIYDKNENYVYIETIIRKIYRSNPYADIVFVITGDYDRLKSDATSEAPIFGKPYAELANHYDIPIIYAGRELVRKICSENDNSYPEYSWSPAWKKYFTDNVHPTQAGYKGYADSIISVLDKNLMSGYSPVPSDYTDKTKAPDYVKNGIYCEKHGKNEGEISVDKMMDATIFGADEIGNPNRTGDYWIADFYGFPAMTSSKGIGAVASFTFNASNVGIWTWALGKEDAPDGTSIYYKIDDGEDTYLKIDNTGTIHKLFTPLATGLEKGKIHTIRLNHKVPDAQFKLLYFLVWGINDGEDLSVSAVPYYKFETEYSVKIGGVEFSDFDTKTYKYEIPVPANKPYPELSFFVKDFYGYEITQATEDNNTATLRIDNKAKFTFVFVKKDNFDVTLSFNTNGAEAIASQTLKAGAIATKPAAPTKAGYTFDGWYKDALFAERFFFGTTPVNSNTYLFARWLDADEVAKRMVLTIDKKEATVFGKVAANDVAPIIRNSRTMLPARFVAENLGAEVGWDEQERKVTIKNDTTEILIYIDSDTAVVNGKDVKLDSPAFIENSRTYTPVRFIVESLGAKIEWKEDEREVVIIK